MHDVEVVKVEDTDEPRLDPEGAIIEVAACGICGTDARTFFNGDPRAPAPWVLGHEPVGIVVEVGEGARLPAGVEKGARVFLGSILTCGECAWCADGLENLCEREELYGYTPHPGAYAEYAAVPPIATKNLIPLPRELPSDLATVADPFACARGAGRVYLTEVSKERLEIALTAVGEFVDDAWVAGADNGVEELLSRTGGAGADRVIVAAPSKQAQQAALVMAGKRARIVYFAGLPKGDPVSPLDMNQLHYKELTILGSYGCTPRQYRITMDYLNRRRDDLGRIVTHRFPLEGIAEAFATIRAGTGLKMVIEPGAPA